MRTTLASAAHPPTEALGQGTPLQCPGCQAIAPSFVVDSRSYDKYIRRRRQCTKCGHRWRTYETTAAEPVPLDIDKVCRAVAKAMGEHPATDAATSMLRAFLVHLARAERG